MKRILALILVLVCLVSVATAEETAAELVSKMEIVVDLS